ncbi:YlbL family protein [Ornithinimicrobium sediminis]|uniref:YlbL family protein n=1 Tax=Ornithinimicrobium sediminis TaxID=2904603 RepID=UPI001E559B3F|nr:PDZ domain-containing protein [Ornithinimicrobium sediminis]
MTETPLSRPEHTGVSARAAIALLLVVATVSVVALLNLVEVPKVIYRPGPVYDTLGEVDGRPVVSIEDVETFPTTGRLDFTTVTVSGGPRFPVTAWDWLTSYLDPSTTVADEADVFPPDATADQIREQNVALMQNSQQEAAVVALRAVGESVPEQVKVAQVIVDAPADGVLRVNDEIRQVDGRDVANPDDVRDILQDFEPGTDVPFRLVRDGEEQTIEVPTGEDEGRTVIGVYIRSDFDLPYEVTIDAGNVGGPSAGLMFSLALYDTITPGELTGGLDFAGTGTINSLGEVGPIGGIQQKLVGADRAGADYFLAPAANCPEVLGHEPEGLTVARIETFDQALELVEALGEGAEVEVPTCADAA